MVTLPFTAHSAARLDRAPAGVTQTLTLLLPGREIFSRHDGNRSSGPDPELSDPAPLCGREGAKRRVTQILGPNQRPPLSVGLPTSLTHISPKSGCPGVLVNQKDENGWQPIHVAAAGHCIKE